MHLLLITSGGWVILLEQTELLPGIHIPVNFWIYVALTLGLVFRFWLIISAKHEYNISIYSLSILSIYSLTVIGTKLSCSGWRTRLLCFLFFFSFFFFVNSWVLISRRTSFAATAKGYSVSPVSCWSYQSICISMQTSFNSVAVSFPTRLKQNSLSSRKEHVLNQILFYVYN